MSIWVALCLHCSCGIHLSSLPSVRLCFILAPYKVKNSVRKGPLSNPSSFWIFPFRAVALKYICSDSSLCRICSLVAVLCSPPTNQINSTLAGMMYGSKIRYKNYFQSWASMILHHFFFISQEMGYHPVCNYGALYNLWSQLTQIKKR